MHGSSSTNIRVLLVDDHPTIRQTLRSTLVAHSNIEVVGEASDGEEALVRVEDLQPAVVVMDTLLFPYTEHFQYGTNAQVSVGGNPWAGPGVIRVLAIATVWSERREAHLANGRHL